MFFNAEHELMIGRNLAISRPDPQHLGDLDMREATTGRQTPLLSVYVCASRGRRRP